ncbi:flavin reductase like domain-containing protein [Mycena sanguinolenta]|nr:flavin reductase like domain-containing protein [Mycena sanguinolenta]
MPNSIFGPLLARSYSSARCTASTEATKNGLRALLRQTAQPVAVVTSILKRDPNVYHGATLSSFTSLAMDPLPLVAFALRIPSRMAESLNPSSSNPSPAMVINILSAEQASVSATFSRPDLYPHPFSTTPYFLNEDGQPVIRGSLGAIACKMVLRVPLRDLRRADTAEEKILDSTNSSELFIAEVLRVEEGVLGDDAALPLLYHQRMYTTCIPGDLPDPEPRSR